MRSSCPGSWMTRSASGCWRSPGVAQVSRSGGVSREIRVDLDPARMESYGITAGEVNQQLRLVNVDAAGGRAQVGGSEQSIRVLGGAHSASQLGEVRLTMPDGRVARLQRYCRRARRHRGGAQHLALEWPAGDHFCRVQGQGRLGRDHTASGARRSWPRSARKHRASRSSRSSPPSTSRSSNTNPRSKRWSKARCSRS